MGNERGEHWVSFVLGDEKKKTGLREQWQQEDTSDGVGRAGKRTG